MNKEEIRNLAKEIEHVIEAYKIVPSGFTLTINVTREQFAKLQETFDGKTAGRLDFVMAEGNDNWAITFTAPMFEVRPRKEE